jgi:hypothetical protein
MFIASSQIFWFVYKMGNLCQTRQNQTEERLELGILQIANASGAKQDFLFCIQNMQLSAEYAKLCTGCVFDLFCKKHD